MQIFCLKRKIWGDGGRCRETRLVEGKKILYAGIFFTNSFTPTTAVKTSVCVFTELPSLLSTD